MMASSQPPACRVMSELLTVREKEVLCSVLEPQSKLIRTAVAQVLVAKQSQTERPGWRCFGCGLVCLLEDQSIQSHFLRLYCVKRAKLLWQQELYIPFKYSATCMFFHTFPADGHQVGLNFAKETEANEFHLAVKTVQRKQEKMTWMVEITNAEDKNKSTSDPPDSGIKPLDHLDKGKPISKDARSTAVTSTSSSFKDLDPTMMRQLMQPRFTEKGPVSQTWPKAAGPSVSLALKNRPLPPVPSITGSTTSQHLPHQSQIEPFNPPFAPVPPEKIRDSASAKPVGPLTAAERGEAIVTTLREIFKQKHQRGTCEDGSQ